MSKRSPTIEPPKSRKAMRFGEIMSAMAQAVGDGTIPRRPFVLPALPPGVIPNRARVAMDNAQAANLSWLNSQQGYCGLAFPGYPYLSELAQRSEYRSPTEVIAKELTREWGTFTGASEDKLRELEDAFEEFHIQACLRAVAMHDGFFGRGQLYIHIKGQDTDNRRKLPLIVDAKNGGATIPKGSLLGFKAVEPIWTTPYMYNTIDPTQPDFYKPQWWYVLGKQTHSSRLLTFVSRPLPDILKPSYNFGGMSLSQLIEPYVNRWLKTVDSVNRLISNFSITALATNMQASLEEDSSGNSLFKRAAMFNAVRDNRGLMLLDLESEDLLQRNTPLSGLSELQAQAQVHMAAPTHIPLVKLTGITPAGLNANSDGEIKVFYDFIASEQQDLFDAHLQHILKIVQCHLWGKVDPKIKFEWIALDTPTDKEESEMRKADGDRDAAYVTNSIVSPDEVRQRLRNDPKSGYTFLTGDAPTPLLEQEHELGQEGAEADHERGKETAEEAHARALELEREKSKGKKAEK